MPAVIEQVERMSVSDKMRLLEYLVRSLSIAVGKWRLPTDEEDRAMDAEIESMFECLQEGE